MRIFVTGASGFIGSAVVPELLGAGHDVVGLARSDASAEALRSAGAEVHRGSLDDPDSLRDGAAGSDGVVHLAYNHDFTQMAQAAATDRAAIEAMADALGDTGAPLVITSGTLGLARGRVAAEDDMPASGPDAHPRVATQQATLALADRGIRPVVVRLAPSVHGAGDGGFVPFIVQVARDTGVSAYVGDGANRWPAVHRSDAATLFRLAVESAPAKAILHGTAEEGIAIRDVAETIGRELGVPTRSIQPDDAAAHFQWMANFIGADVPASSAKTRELLGWQPTGPGLLEDMAAHYFN